MNDNKDFWRFIQFILMVVVIIFFMSAGYQVSKLSFNLGPLQIGLEKKTPTPVEDIPIQILTPYEDVPIPINTSIAAPSASDAVYYYFSQVSEGNFETTWMLLTDDFKHVKNPTGFGPYKDYWSTVDKVIVTNISLVYDDGKTATILADLEYYYFDGRNIPVLGLELDMIYDAQRQVWLIDSTK